MCQHVHLPNMQNVLAVKLMPTCENLSMMNVSRPGLVEPMASVTMAIPPEKYAPKPPQSPAQSRQELNISNGHPHEHTNELCRQGEWPGDVDDPCRPM
jgi:hypothetical protein